MKLRATVASPSLFHPYTMERIAAQETTTQRVGMVEVSKTETIYAGSNYVAEAVQTKSNQFNGSLVSKQQFVDIIVMAIKALQDLDVLKKTLFYGKLNPLIRPVNGPNDCNTLRMEALSDSPFVGIDILHSIIGKATESGEQLEALFDAAVYGKPFDIPNAIEEVGDGQWYDAILANALDFTFEDAQRINIAKLRQRYPDKFTAFDAINRDLPAERKILEQK